MGVGTEGSDNGVSDGNAPLAEGLVRRANTNEKGCGWLSYSLSRAINWVQGLASRLMQLFTDAR